MKTPSLLFSVPFLVSVLASQPAGVAQTISGKATTSPVQVTAAGGAAVQESPANPVAAPAAVYADEPIVPPTPAEVSRAWETTRRAAQNMAVSETKKPSSETSSSSTTPSGTTVTGPPVTDPLAPMPDVADAPSETRKINIHGRYREMDILMDRVHIRPRSGGGFDHYVAGMPNLKALDTAASNFDLAGQERADLIAYPSGKERKDSNKVLITRRICVRLAEGVAFGPFATKSGAYFAERPYWAEEALILTYSSAFDALDAVERLRKLPGVLGTHSIIARQHIPNFVPQATYFSGGGPAWAPVPLTDNVDGWSPPTFLTPFAPPTSAYEWWANNIGTIPLPAPLVPIPIEIPGTPGYLFNPLPGGPRTAGAPAPVRNRVDLGDFPPISYDPVNFPKFSGEMSDLRLPLAWENIGDFDLPVSGRLRKVLIIDNGIHKSHSDLFNAVDLNNQRHWNYFNETPNPDPIDPATDTHGTALAGLVGARIKPVGSRITGVAPGCNFHSVVALKGFVDDFEWADAFAFAAPPASGSSNNGGGPPEGNNRGTLKDTDRDNEWLDEDRSGFVYFEVALNALAAQGAQDATELFTEDWLWKRAIRFSATKGAAQRGVPFITSSGNGGNGHMNTNYMEQKNTIYQIPVGGVSELGRRIPESVVGANVVVVAPSTSTNGQDELPPYLNWPNSPPGWPTNRPFQKNPPIEPDDLPANWRRISVGVPTLTTNNGLNFNFGGTSAPAAMVAGVVAMMLEVNPSLQARDIKEILMRSARVCNDIRVDRGPTTSPNDDDILIDDFINVTIGSQTYQLKTGQTWRMSPMGHPVHHAFGAGLVDADKAIKIAKKWTPLPVNPLPPIKRDVTADNFGATVANRNTETGGLYFPVMSSQLIPTNGLPVDVIVPGPPAGMRIEHIEVRVKFYHKRRGDLEIKLIAPPEAGWEKGRELESDLFVPHREDYNEDRWSATVPELRDPSDWTFTTVRHWGTMVDANSGGVWKVRIRDAVTQGPTTAPSVNDPIYCPVGNPTDTQSQRIEGVGITYHGTYGKAIKNSPPEVTSGNIRFEPSNKAQSVQLQVGELGRDGSSGEIIYPVTSWDFWKGEITRADGRVATTYTPVQPTPPPVDFLEFFPPQARDAVDPNVHVPISALGVPWPLQPNAPMWISFQLDPNLRPATWPPPPASGAMGALTQRPRWAELTLDELWVIIRDTKNTNQNTNFIHARLNRRTGQLEIVPLNRGKYLVSLYAENLLGLSKPKEIEITVTPPGYEAWADVYWDAPDLSSPAFSGPVSGWLADPDADGIVNGLEYALRLNPTIGDNTQIPAYRVEGNEAIFSWSQDQTATDASVHAQISEDLSAWADVTPTMVGSANGLADYEYRVPLDGDPRIFFRLWSDYNKNVGNP